jgi:hypothetical protein
MCIRKENIKKIIIASIITLIISQVIHTIGAVLTMNYYTDEAYAQVWSKIMMPAMGPPPVSFYIISMLSAFVFALIFVSVYDIFEASVPGKTWKKKGLYYGSIVFLLTAQSYVTMSYLINLPGMLLLEWAFEGLILSLLAGLVAARFIPSRK